MEQKQKLKPHEAYKIGDIIEFKIVRVANDFCEILDENTGINAYPQGTGKLHLFKGQTVKCRILAVTERHPKTEFVNLSDFEQTNENLTEEKLSELLSQQEHPWSAKDFMKLLLTDEKEKSFEAQCHTWIQNLLNKKIDLQEVRRDCSDLLELSDLLNICSDNERDFYQGRLTLLIEQLGYYIAAAELINNETGDDANLETPEMFINSILNKLKTSGFVYHPVKNFNILSSLFLRKPELMNDRIKELLTIIYGRDIKYWEKEPFNSALTKLLELYVRECDGKIDKTKDNVDLIDTNIKAIALQLLLLGKTKDSSIANYQLNSARLCNLSSYKIPDEADKLIDSAVYYMLHSSARLPKYELDKIAYLPHFIKNTPIGKIDTINTFTKGKNRLVVNPEGIYLSASSEPVDNLYPVLPKGLELWNNLQVFLPSKNTIKLNSLADNNIKGYEDAWKEIELDFFNVSKSPAAKIKKSKKQHKVGDYVEISFTAQDENDRNKYYCQIEDETGGNGFIFINDIVPYNIATTSLRHFQTNDGSRLVFPARISATQADMFHFSMLEEIKETVTDRDYGFYSYREEITCSVGSAPNTHGSAPAVTKEGVSVSIENAADFPGLRRNSIVSCRLIGTADNDFHIVCRMENFVSCDFDLTSAFKTLIRECAIGEISETVASQEEQIMESDKVLDEAYVKELIFLIDRKALVDKDYIKAYNYLGFARLLSLLIGWDAQAAYYKGRMDIISMLHYFAKNSHIDTDELEKLENANEELFSNNPVLKDRFLQLQTVSFLGKATHDEELFSISRNNPALANLASLVMAYNTVRRNKMEKVSNDIYNRIMQLLKLKGNEIGLRYYGEESEECEFKTSIIFTAEGKKSRDEQMREILRVINSFMNTNGGTLYVGVNDSGYGVGVENDLIEYNHDTDNYKREIEDAVALKWDNKILTTYVQSVEFDQDNTDKDVLVIKVRRHEAGIPFDGKWFVRKGGSKRGLTEQEFLEYKIVGRVQGDTPPNDEISVVEEMTGSGENAPAALEEDQFIKSKEDSVKTSRLRANVLANYEENYVEPIAYFRFLGSGKFVKFTNYDYYEKESLLTLVVKDEEKNASLVLGYEDGHIVKVSVEELLDYKDNKDYTRNGDKKLIFASIAGEDDAILTISREDNSRATTVMRLDDLSFFEEDKLSSVGEMPFNEGLADGVLAFDIIPHDCKSKFSSILNKKKTTAGSSSNARTAPMVEQLHSWGITEI